MGHKCQYKQPTLSCHRDSIVISTGNDLIDWDRAAGLDGAVVYNNDIDDDNDGIPDHLDDDDDGDGISDEDDKSGARGDLRVPLIFSCSRASSNPPLPCQS